jgi:hypothetical protein
VTPVRKLNNVKPSLFVFPFSNKGKRFAIKWMMGADDSDFIEIGVTMRSVISRRMHMWLHACVNHGVSDEFRPVRRPF